MEHQRQAAMNVTVRNVITSMRLMSAFDWAEFFESVSLVDAMLRADTRLCRSGLRDPRSYRHAIEELARGSPHAELEVARRAVAPGATLPGRGAEKSQRPPWGPPERSRLLPHRARACRLRAGTGFRVPIKAGCFAST